MKSEPEAFSIDDLKHLKRDAWSGVRNYLARNYMKEMRVGDLMLFHHSSVNPAGVVGIGKIVAAAHPDETQFDKKSPYFDPKATKAKPIWYCVDVGFAEKFPRMLTLDELRGVKALKDMVLLERGSRLSVQPVTDKEFAAIVRLAK